MKKFLVWLLLVAMTLSLFAGCSNQEADTEQPSATVSAAEAPAEEAPAEPTVEEKTLPACKP